jgi:hypothetical protein
MNNQWIPGRSNIVCKAHCVLRSCAREDNYDDFCAVTWRDQEAVAVDFDWSRDPADLDLHCLAAVVSNAPSRHVDDDFANSDGALCVAGKSVIGGATAS